MNWASTGTKYISEYHLLKELDAIRIFVLKSFAMKVEIGRYKSVEMSM